MENRCKWSRWEDERLRSAIEKCGIDDWTVVSQRVPGRLPKQCRERWHNYLHPHIRKDSMDSDEIMFIVEARNIIGNRWSEIAKRMPGRTSTQVKNLWYSLNRNKMPGIERSKLPSKRNHLKFTSFSIPPKVTPKFIALVKVVEMCYKLEKNHQ